MNKPSGKKRINTAPTSGKPAPTKSVQTSGSSNPNLWLFAILALTFIVFFPSLNNALTNWDDPAYLNENPLIRNLNWASVKRIFTEIYFGNYQPLHILSYAVEYHFYQLNPVGYHTTSVIMHLIVTALVYRFIFLLSQNTTIALITALLFGIHPLHVESVAWAAERKDLLYAMFFLGSINFYIRYIQSAEKSKYLFYALLLFALSIFSKAMASSLPPVLILLDFYFGRKFSFKLVLEKLPFFALAIAMGMVSVITVSKTGQTSLQVYTLFERILFANFNLLAYVGKLILPINLSAFYPYPFKVDGQLPYYCYIAPVVVGALLVLIVRSLKYTKAIFFGAGFFVACIFLVLQLFPVGPTIMSERYSYLPSIGFFFVVAYFIHQLITNRVATKAPIYIALSGYSLFLSVATYKRCDVWKDSMTLWTNVLEQFPYVGTALNNRGNIYGKERGDLDRAILDFNASIQYEPGYENAYANRGIVYCMRGQFDLAIADFNKAVQLKPGYFDALFNRGIAYIQTQQHDKAIADYTTLIKDKPEDARLYSYRGWAYLQAGNNDSSLVDLNQAIMIDPALADAYYRRANVYFNKKLFSQAYADVQQAVSLGMTVDQKYFETIKTAAQPSSGN